MTEELERLKRRISELYTQREQLKSTLENGHIPAREGFKKLHILDTDLSQLDSCFKQLWDELYRKK